MGLVSFQRLVKAGRQRSCLARAEVWFAGTVPTFGLNPQLKALHCCFTEGKQLEESLHVGKGLGGRQRLQGSGASKFRLDEKKESE